MSGGQRQQHEIHRAIVRVEYTRSNVFRQGQMQEEMKRLILAHSIQRMHILYAFPCPQHGYGLALCLGPPGILPDLPSARPRDYHKQGSGVKQEITKVNSKSMGVIQPNLIINTLVMKPERPRVSLPRANKILIELLSPFMYLQKFCYTVQGSLVLL